MTKSKIQVNGEVVLVKEMEIIMSKLSECCPVTLLNLKYCNIILLLCSPFLVLHCTFLSTEECHEANASTLEIKALNAIQETNNYALRSRFWRILLYSTKSV